MEPGLGFRRAGLILTCALTASFSLPPPVSAEEVVIGFRGHVETIDSFNMDYSLQVGEQADGYFLFNPLYPLYSLTTEFALGVPVGHVGAVRRVRGSEQGIYCTDNFVSAALSTPHPVLGLFNDPSGGGLTGDFAWAYLDISYEPMPGAECGGHPFILPPVSSFDTGYADFMWGYEDAFGSYLAHLRVIVRLDSLFEVPKVCWDPVDQAEEYQVVRAGNLSLPHCATRFLSDPCWQDPTIPRPGEVLQYLARPSRPFAGDWGFDSEGHDRFITCSDCPPEPGGPLVLDSCLECPEQRESCEHIRGKALADVACPVVSYEQPRYCKDDPYCNGMCGCTLTWDDPECDWASGQMCVSSSEMQSRCFRDFCPRVQDTLQYLSVALINGRAWFLNLDNDATYQCDLVQDCTLDQFDCIGDAAAGQTVPVWSHSPFPPNPVCATDVIRIDTDNVPDSSPCQTGECSYDCTVVTE